MAVGDFVDLSALNIGAGSTVYFKPAAGVVLMQLNIFKVNTSGYAGSMYISNGTVDLPAPNYDNTFNLTNRIIISDVWYKKYVASTGSTTNHILIRCVQVM
jgi:hypothetical protein